MIEYFGEEWALLHSVSHLGGCEGEAHPGESHEVAPTITEGLVPYDRLLRESIYEKTMLNESPLNMEVMYELV